MKKLAQRAAAVVAAAGIGLGGLLVSASPAAAATYGGECGSGYGVVNQDSIGSKGTVFLTYNSSNGYNCVVAKRNNPGSAVLIEAGLSISPAGNHWDVFDGGYYTTYAGPIYLNAANRCVDWMGRITGTEGGKRGTNCG
ncbi:spore-associated protein A [Nocardiopsis sp. HUAS JQ3]|uniref:spore-associated protein A n=1 Tax=Nocardiopsis sp. HUAS JQ3 TaxID=3061629 RepID=UPI0023A9DD23|nr:spore-associated protein A [Nocardiopsis sp. HUAS JQ3]WDZ88574.1 spore-associated protein A [Nocardiopsis sp. HUAS JQ3]